MPNFATGNMWEAPAHHFVITTNASIKSNGAVVMGKGAAAEAKSLFPGIDLVLGRKIKNKNGLYYLEFCGWYDIGRKVVAGAGKEPVTVRRKVGVHALQVKHQFHEPADIVLIERSVKMLKVSAELFVGLSISMNFPGIGNGKLKRKDVLPLLECLPDNVTVWEKGN